MKQMDDFNAAAPEPKAAGNTVGGHPEPQFRAAWIHMLSRAMLTTGRGFRMDSPNRKPPKGASKWRGERRPDKDGTKLLEVVDARPPNFDAILAVLPEAANPGVMFAYGGKVYYPGGKGPLSRELDAHERVHIERQNALEGGADKWWELYLTDAAFRYNEELFAHQAEYAMFCRRFANPIKRAQFLHKIATRLASPLYGLGTTVEREMAAIRSVS